MAMVLILSLGAALTIIAHAEGLSEATVAPVLQTEAPDDFSLPAVAIDLTPLLQAVLSLAVSLITAFLIPWIRAKYSYEQRQRIVAAYQTVVYAAEQMFGSGMGEQKLEWAVRELEGKGMIVDRAAIEAEVRKMQSLGAALLADGAKSAGTAVGTGG
jgi:hypothetical protein